MGDRMSELAQMMFEAERSVRRGELKQALQIYRELLERAPRDTQVHARIATIESLLQPHELSGSPSSHAMPGLDLSRSTTLEQTAEMLFERGDLAGAIATYERVLRERPDHELARERCVELKRLFDLHAPPVPGRATPGLSLPRGKSDMLEALLGRIASRRKP